MLILNNNSCEGKKGSVSILSLADSGKCIKRPTLLNK